MSIRQGSNIISGAKSKELGLLTPQWYDYVLEDINWIRADSFSWHKGAFYTATYQHLLNDINGKTPQSETIEGTTITYYLADDGHKIVERNQESAVQTIYENTGASWYYIIDRNNSLFKLPRVRAQAENMHLYFYAGNFAQSLDENNPTVPITGETNWGEIGGVLSDQTDLQDVLDSKAFLTDIGNATLTIQKNATTIDTFTANSKTDKTINIVVPTTPQEVNALPDTTKYAANASLTIDSSTYVVTLQLKDQDGSNIGTAQTIDLPLESVVVSGRYDSANKKIILTLQDGSTIDIPVADLIAGLQSEITSTNKLDADLVDDTTAAHKFVTASDKTTWNAKQDAISDLSTIRSNAIAGKGAADTIATYGDIVTHDVSEFATSTQGGKADTAIQPGDNISELTNDAAYVQTLSDLGITATASEINTLDGITASTSELNILDGATVTTAELNVLDGITASTTELNYTDGVTSNIQTQLDDKVAKNTAITGATKTKITYDSKGLVTAGDDLVESDIPSLHLSKVSDVTATATELNYVSGVTSSVQNQLDDKVVKTSGASKVYGTDANGDQTTYDYNSFGKVDDVKVGTTSVVTNKIANLGTMAGETATNYYTKVSADGTFIKVNPTITGATKTKITYDAKGLVTAGDDLVESDIPSLHLSKISDVTATATEVNYLSGATSNIQTQLNAKAADSDVVHTTGNETINGTKTFNETLQLKSNLSFRSYGSNDSGRLQFRAQPSDNVIRGTVAITDGYTTAGSGYNGFVAQMVARSGTTSSDPFNTMRVSNKGIEYIKEANDGTITGQYVVVDNNGLVPSDRLAISGTTGQVLTKTASGQSWGTLATVATTGAYADLTGTPTIGNATLTIQKNGTDIDTFTANATVDQTINITVPTQASDVNALPDTTKYAASASLSINSSTYVITLQLKDQDGNNIGTAQTIDLPLESVVVSGSYDSSTKEVVLTLQDGSTIRFSVADLVSGLQSEITSTNKLDADLVDDSTSAHKFVTSSDKTTWSGKQDALVSGTNIKTINNNSLLGSGDLTIDSLPSQSGNTGKFLTTDGTDASWSDKPLVNKGTGGNSLTILGYAANMNGTNIGANSRAGAIASTALGCNAEATGYSSLALGAAAKASAIGAIQLGQATNNSVGTMYVNLTTSNSTAGTNYKLLDSDGTIPADRLVNSINKYSTMPTAASINEGWIVQYIGATDSTYTHGYIYECISDGASTPTYSWTQVDVQPTPDPLPSQSGNSGKFLTTDGTNASWGDALVNTATAQNALTILGTPNTTSNNSRSINVGYNSSVSKWDAIALGAGSIAKESNSLSIGDGSEAWNMPSIAIGSHAVAKGTFSIQLGGSPYGSMFSTNDEANTLKVCLGANTQNYKLLDGNGTIPEARLADTTSATSGQVLQLDSNLNAVWATPQAGSSTLSNLTDVTITSASSGQVLSYNGTNWENSEPTPAMVIVDYTAA